MSDFDNFFRDRLEEEERFPGLPDNWAKLNSRLDQYGFPQTPRTGWQRFLFPGAAVATIGLLVVLGWKVVQVQRENAALQAQVAVLKEKMALPPEQSGVARVESIAPANQPAPLAQTTPANPDPAQLPASTPAATSNLPSLPPSTVHPSPSLPPSTVATNMDAGKPVDDSPTLPKNNAPIPDGAKNVADNQTAGSGTTQPSPAPAALPAPNTNDTLKSNAATTALNAVPDTSKTLAPVFTTNQPDQPIAAASNNNTPIDTATVAAVASLPDTTLSPAPVAPVVANPTAIAAAPPVAAQPDTTTNAPSPIKPQKIHWKPGLYVNAHVLAGNRTGARAGLSAMQGQGLSAEIGILKSLRLTAGVDWLRQDIVLETRRPNFHLPHDDPPHGMQQMLENIEGTLRQRQISAGLKYLAPVRGKIKPSIQVAYAWRNIPAQIFQFKYKEEHPGGGPGGPGQHDEHFIFAQKSDKQRVKNLLRTGVGADWQANRWAFGLGVEYGLDLNTARKTDNDWFIRAGVTYQL